MIKAVIPALLAATMVVGPASANFMTGNSILQECRDRDESYVLGYVAGVADVIGSIEEYGICLPQKATTGQLKDVFCQYIEKHPERRHETAELLAYAALLRAFPCKK